MGPRSITAFLFVAAGCSSGSPAITQTRIDPNPTLADAGAVVDAPPPVPTVGTPMITANSYAPTTVTIATTTPDAAIFYTLDGTAPTGASTPYVAPFQIACGATIRGIATRDGWRSSDVGEAVVAGANGSYIDVPRAKPGTGTFAAPITVTLEDPKATGLAYDAIYYFTSNDAEATATTLYTGPITVDHTMTIHALGKGHSETCSGDIFTTATVANTYTITSR